ncbi:MAG: J domain-containing protein [Candidatus Micrarchaeota archaeon]|nr:J domain-containing protein [Candidatus Micrarchaeota archaeon]
MEAAKERKLYGILGVERSASGEEIRLAYRKLAKELHPDVNLDNPSAAERMKHVNAAYTILGDPELRARYDQRGDQRERS